MTRLPNWPEALNAFFDERRAMPFAWGTNDCGTFFADAVIAMTGKDPLKGRRTWKTEKAALRLLRKTRGLRGLFASFEEVPLKLAQRGSGVIAVVEGRETMGVMADGCWVGPGERGLLARPLSEVVMALKV